MFSARPLVSLLTRRPALVAAFVVALVAVLPAAASATVAGTASVNPQDSYRGKAAQSYTFTVTNTSTASEAIGSVRFTRPNNQWTITGCTTTRTGWIGAVAGTGQNANGLCEFTKTTGTSIPTTAGSNTQDFTVTATVAAGADLTSTNNLAWTGDVAVTTNLTSSQAMTAASAGSLAARAWNFEITKAVLSNTGGTIGMSCPADNKTAPAGSTQTVVICGFQRTGAPATPLSAQSTTAGSSMGTMISSAGIFSSGSVPSGTEVVLANYSTSTVTSTAGTGKTIAARVGSSATQTSPATPIALTGYEATHSNTTLQVTSAGGTYGGTGTLVASLTSSAIGVAGKTIDFTLNGTSVGNAVTNASGVATLTGVSLAGKNANTYTNAVHASFTTDPGFEGSSGDGDLVVTKKAADVTADNQSKSYGAGDPTFSSTPSGLAGGDTSLANVSCDVAGTHVNVGAYDITCSSNPADNPNYDITFHKGTLTIDKRVTDVTANDQSKTYGNSDPTFDYTVSNFGNGDTALNNISCGVTGTHDNVGPYDITCSGAAADNPNYAITFKKGTLTVGKRATDVTASPQSKTYGQADPTFGYAVSNFGNGDTTLNNITCGVAATHVNAGAYDITCSGDAADNPNYNITFKKGTFTVNKKAADVTADNQTKSYGDADPTFTYAKTGLTNGDTSLSNINCAVAGAHANVGAYDITCSSTASDNPNYNITFHKGTLTVNKKTADVTAANKTKTYGSADPTFTYTASGLAGGDTTLTNVNCGVTGAHVNAGAYDITCSSTPTDNPNYDLTFHKGTLTVGKKSADVTADDQSKTYGTSDPTFTYTPTGFAGGDTSFSGVTCAVAAAHVHVNNYAIDCTADAASNPNYNITFHAGTLTVNPKAADVTADNQSKTYGQADPAFTYTPTGLTNGDTTLSGVSCGVTGAHANVAAYDITCSGNTNSDYSVTYHKGTLTVDKKAADVTADNQSKTYGQADPAFTYTPSNLANGDTTLTGVTCAAASPHVHAGSYDITCSADPASNPNYGLTFHKGTFTVNPKATTVTADDKVKQAGASDPAFTHTDSNLETGDSLSDVTCGVSGAHSTPGTYPIVCSGNTNGDYNASYVDGTLTVGQKTADVTATDKTKSYGSADPTFTHTESGVDAGDDLQGVTCEVAVAHTLPGTYDIVCSGNTNANYAVAYHKGTLTVTKKSLPASFTAANKTYDGNTAATITGRSLDTSAIEHNGPAGAPDAVQLDATKGTAAFASKSAGNNKTVNPTGFELTGADKDNYTLSMGNAQANITAKQLTGGFTADDKAYDGTTAATGARSVTGKIGTDDVNLSGGTATFGSKAAGPGKTVTLSGATLSGADASNYSLASGAITDTADITPKTIQGAFKVADKDYDGTTAATIILRVVGGAISGDDVSLAGGTAAFTDANPGSGKTTTGSGFTLAGADASNYSLGSVIPGKATIRERVAPSEQPTDDELASDALGGGVDKLGLTFGGLADAFVPDGQAKSITIEGGTSELMALVCGSDCTVDATGQVVNLGSAGASAAATRKFAIKRQKLTLKRGQAGVVKLKLSKKQRKLIAGAKRPKLVMTITLNSGGKKVTQKKTFKLKAPKKN